MRAAGEALIAARYLLSEDLQACVAAALERFDAAAGARPISAEEMSAERAAE